MVAVAKIVAALHGGTIGAAYEPTGEWIATITADFVAVGTVRVRTASGVDAYVSQWNGDGELGGSGRAAADADEPGAIPADPGRATRSRPGRE